MPTKTAAKLTNENIGRGNVGKLSSEQPPTCLTGKTLWHGYCQGKIPPETVPLVARSLTRNQAHLANLYFQAKGKASHYSQG